MTAGKKVVLLTYSQGTLYGKEVYNQIAEEHPEFKNSIIQVGVGAIVTSIANNGFYVTYEGDGPVNGVRTLDNKVLPANYFASSISERVMLFAADHFGYSFEKIYLNPKAGMRSMVLKAVKDAANAIDVMVVPSPSRSRGTSLEMWICTCSSRQDDKFFISRAVEMRDTSTATT